MRVYLERRVILGLITAPTVLAGLGGLSFIPTYKSVVAGVKVAHSQDVPYPPEQLLPAFVKSKTSLRTMFGVFQRFHRTAEFEGTGRSSGRQSNNLFFYT